MKFLYILSCLVLLSFISCTEETKKTEHDLTVESKHEGLEPGITSSLSDEQSENGFFNPQASFSVSDISTPHDYPSSLDDPSICEGWQLQATDISHIIKGARVIEGSEWHHIFDHLPCNHQAVITQGQMEYELSINGGSWMSISNSDSSILMGVFDEKFETYFLSEPAREDDH